MEKTDLSPITKTEDVVVTYKDGKIAVKGATLYATIDITSAQLQSVYWKGKGVGKLTVQLQPLP